VDEKMKKQEIQQLLDRFPDDVDPEKLMENLYLKMKLDRSERALEEGRVISDEDLVRETDEWFQ
jgi:hypothetical protein